MEQIVDIFYIKPQILESADNKFLKFQGVFQRADTVNENGRIYPRKVLEKAVEDFKRKIDEGRAVGTIEHPADGKTKAYEISHKITNIYMNENGEVIGEAIVVETSKGRELKALLEAGISIGISSRGFGSLKPVSKDGKTIYEVQEDFQIETFDVVYDPSTPGAFVSVYESKDDIKVKEKMEDFAKKLINAFKGYEKERLTDFAEKLLENVNPDVRSSIAIHAIANILQPILSDGKESVLELKKRIEKLELENYKLSKIAESHEPEKLKQVLQECKTIEEVDKKIREYRQRKVLSRNESLNNKIDESSIRRKRFLSKFTGTIL